MSDEKKCRKAPHTGYGYLHDEDYDGPYDVDGVEYCGRCHFTMMGHSIRSVVKDMINEKTDAKKPEADGIRAAEEINDLFNPQINPDLCRDGKARLKKMRAIITAVVDRERERTEKIAKDIFGDALDVVDRNKFVALIWRIRQGGK